jgi:hypothetical protein
LAGGFEKMAILRPVGTLAFVAALCGATVLFFSFVAARAESVTMASAPFVQRPSPHDNRPARPFKGAIWLGGHWDWVDGRSVWVAGRWDRPDNRAHLWHHGYWDNGEVPVHDEYH